MQKRGLGRWVGEVVGGVGEVMGCVEGLILTGISFAFYYSTLTHLQTHTVVYFRGPVLDTTHLQTYTHIHMYI